MVDFRIDVVVDPKGAVTGTKTVERQLVNLEGRADALRATLGRAFAFLGGAAVLGTSIRTLASFEQAMSTVGAVTGATGDQLAALTEKALQLGIATRFTSTQAADSLVSLSRAGFTASESLAAVSDTLLLAQAGALGLTEATDITVSAIRGFRLTADQAGRVADVLAKTANSTNTSVGELGEGMKFVAPIAAGLSISLEETSAALGVLSDAGLKASLAGTGLRRVLSELESPSQNTQRILQSLGLTAEQVRVSQVGLTAAIQALADAGIDTGLALEVFGDRGGPAFEVLSKNLPKVEQMTEALGNAAGTAQRTASIMDDNLNGALLRLKSAVEGVILRVGQQGGSAGLRGLIEGLAQGFRFLADNADAVVNFIKNLALFLGPRYLIGAIRALTAAVAANPLGLLLVVIAGVAAAIPDLQGKITSLVSSIAELGNTVASAIDFQQLFAGVAQAIDNVVALFNGLGAAAGAVFDALSQQPEAAAQLMKKYFRDAIEALLDFFLAFEQTVGNIILGIGKDFIELARNVGGALGAISVGNLDAAQTFADNLTGTLSRVGNRLATFTGQFSSNLKKLQGVDILPTVELTREAAELGTTVSNEFQRAVEESRPSASEALDRLLAPQKDLEDEAAKRAAAAAAAAQATGATPAAAPANEPPAATVRAANAENLAARLKLLQEQATAEATYQEILSRRPEIINAINALTGTQAEKEQALNEVLRQRPDLERAISDAMLAAKIAALDTSTALEDGFTRAFLKLQQEANDLASVAENVVNTFADKATDAIVEFARTGEFSFKKFASSVLEEITRILIRLLIVQAISAALGSTTGAGLANVAVGAATSGGGGGGRAKGGTVQPDRSYVVGENGPELFQPRTTGTIVPNQGPAAPPPQVNVQVVNVDDPNNIPQAINKGGADEAIVNLLARNKDRVNQVIR